MAEKTWRDMIRIKVTPSIVEVNPETTALLIVDAQNACCNPTHGALPKLGQTFPEEVKYLLERVTEVWRHCKNKILGHFATRFSFSKRRYRVVFWLFAPTPSINPQ